MPWVKSSKGYWRCEYDCDQIDNSSGVAFVKESFKGDHNNTAPEPSSQDVSEESDEKTYGIGAKLLANMAFGMKTSDKVFSEQTRRGGSALGREARKMVIESKEPQLPWQHKGLGYEMPQTRPRSKGQVEDLDCPRREEKNSGANQEDPKMTGLTQRLTELRECYVMKRISKEEYAEGRQRAVRSDRRSRSVQSRSALNYNCRDPNRCNRDRQNVRNRNHDCCSRDRRSDRSRSDRSRSDRSRSDRRVRRRILLPYTV